MQILIDECLPKKLKRELSGYAVFTVQEMGWAGKKNGELLKLMTGQFDVFITVDGNMSYQQPLDQQSVAFVILVAINNKLETLKPLMPAVIKALHTLQAGQVIEIQTPKDE